MKLALKIESGGMKCTLITENGDEIENVRYIEVSQIDGDNFSKVTVVFDVKDGNINL